MIFLLLVYDFVSIPTTCNVISACAINYSWGRFNIPFMQT